ncbi:hypothetical protein FFLO_02385 [Filobasidium floriforme]|uniref:Rab-GAP TBC domain-containing protein n=1 Tax=Filobasidium floriforme TaxID=5210 RepID=A0A8K0JMR8_9TREE|nr:hypothetical protein FFLO_02385 [Filobasidium floriforme]
MTSYDGAYPRRFTPSPSPSPSTSRTSPLPPEVLTFDPQYPESQYVPRGIGISRFSEDDAFEQNDRRRSNGGGGSGAGAAGGGNGDDGGDDSEDDGQDVAFESVDLDGAGAQGQLSSQFAQSLYLSSPTAVGLSPTGHILQRSSFAYGSNSNTDDPRYSEDANARRPVSANGHASKSFFNISRSTTPRPNPRTSSSHDSHPMSPASPSATVGRRTPDPSSARTTTSNSTSASTSPTPPTQPRPRIHAPPAIPHSLNPSVMAALTSNQYPSTATSSSPQLTALPSKSASGAFSLLKRNSLSLTGSLRNANGGSGSGSSGLDKVRSRTRMVHLPPKDKEEDQAHLERWKNMMEESRSAEQKRLSDAARRASEKSKHQAECIPIWEGVILPAGGPREWKRLVRADTKMGELWFEGIPTHLRGRIWSACIGNGLALSKESYRACAYRAKKAIESDRFPADVMRHIEDDSVATLSTTKLYGKNGPMVEDLRELLAAWYVSRVDEGMGYVRGVHLLAGMLLMNMNIAVAFICLRNLLDRPCLRAFYCGIDEEVEAYYRIFDNLQADLFPKIYANCKTVDVRIPSTYFTTLFLHQIPFEAAVRVWDLIMLEGDGQIFRIGLAILSILEPRLYFPDKKEIQSVFDGRNAAALAIVNREKERARLKGVTYDAEDDGVLAPFGVNEDAIFDALSNDNWKESRYERLLTRELPE